jgi:hypothetical protein
MENKLGRLLRREEDVHHKDENKENDSIENLELLTHTNHAKHHKLRTAPDPIECLCPCGKLFTVKPHRYRLRMGANKTKTLHCSRACGSSFSRNII